MMEPNTKVRPQLVEVASSMPAATSPRRAHKQSDNHLKVLPRSVPLRKRPKWVDRDTWRPWHEIDGQAAEPPPVCRVCAFRFSGV